MQITTKAIVLSSIKYGDTSLIVKAYTASDGLKSYLLKGVLTSRRGKLKAAYFLPLSQLELVVIHKNKGTLERISEAKILYPYSSIHTHILKNTITLFLAEMLSNSIREEEQNELLYGYIEAALQWLDTHDKIANFHLYFLVELTKYLGFYPDSENMNAPYFDMSEGAFVNKTPLNPTIDGEELVAFRYLLGINFDAIQAIKLTNKLRQSLLQSIVQYFEIHLHGFKKPRSLAVLNEVFG
jgi:DNA repair protein RecO (recombination protein O)